jgi:hypothetical protein
MKQSTIDLLKQLTRFVAWMALFALAVLVILTFTGCAKTSSPTAPPENTPPRGPTNHISFAGWNTYNVPVAFALTADTSLYIAPMFSFSQGAQSFTTKVITYGTHPPYYYEGPNKEHHMKTRMSDLWAMNKIYVVVEWDWTSNDTAFALSHAESLFVNPPGK